MARRRDIPLSDAFAAILREVAEDRATRGALVDVIMDYEPRGTGWEWVAEFERGQVTGRTVGERIERTRQGHTAAIRQWARGEGYVLPGRGPLPSYVLDAYQAAHSEGVTA